MNTNRRYQLSTDFGPLSCYTQSSFFGWRSTRRFPGNVMNNLLKSMALAGILLCGSNADPAPVRHIQGYLHWFVVLKDLNDKILASGDVTQNPTGNRVTTILSLHFKDGSLYQETSVFSQQKVFRLLRYKQIQEGPSFKTPHIFSFDSSGNVTVEYTDNGSEKDISDHISLPTDLANGIITTLLIQIDPKTDIGLSMLVSTPKPRVVKLKIVSAGEDSFLVGGVAAKATHYLINIDIGGVTGAVAKVVGKQPPPMHVWVAENAPVFLKSEGQLYEGGPICGSSWRALLA
jgi:hypothetical protein